ncbi:MAG: HD domain-containing protein [Patescibacteria group bacterium]
MKKVKETVNFIFELAQLKRQRHVGFQLIGVKNPGTVAEHALRAAQIGYILAVQEGVSPEKVTTMLVIHDNGETRIGDQHKVAARYFSTKGIEEQAVRDQLSNVEEGVQKKWFAYWKEYEERDTLEGVVAKDADWLEMAFQAKEYLDIGYAGAQEWIDNIEKALETDTAKKILAEMKETTFREWFKGLKKMTYNKLNKQ